MFLLQKSSPNVDGCMFLVVNGNVWKEVCSMDDLIPVNYDTIEQLFCQKQIESDSVGVPAKQVPTKVKRFSETLSILLHVHVVFFSMSNISFRFTFKFRQQY